MSPSFVTLHLLVLDIAKYIALRLFIVVLKDVSYSMVVMDIYQYAFLNSVRLLRYASRN